ncbi:hypothetical protein ACIXN4_21755, partial [Bacteroides fragilis]
VGQGDIVGRSGYFSLNLSANSVMRGRLDARRTLKSLVADLRIDYIGIRDNMREAMKMYGGGGNTFAPTDDDVEQATTISENIYPYLRICLGKWI